MSREQAERLAEERVELAVRATRDVFQQEAERQRRGLTEELIELRSALAEERHGRGLIEGRLTEVGTRLAATQRAHARDLEAAEARAWNLSAESGATVRELTRERTEAHARVRLLEERLANAAAPAIRLRQTQARVQLGLAAGCALVAALVLPALALTLSGGERAQYFELATGLGAGPLLASFLLLATGAVSLGWWASGQLRALAPADWENPSSDEHRAAGDPLSDLEVAAQEPSRFGA